MLNFYDSIKNLVSSTALPSDAERLLMVNGLLDTLVQLRNQLESLKGSIMPAPTAPPIGTDPPFPAGSLAQAFQPLSYWLHRESCRFEQNQIIKRRVNLLMTEQIKPALERLRQLHAEEASRAVASKEGDESMLNTLSSKLGAIRSDINSVNVEIALKLGITPDVFSLYMCNSFHGSLSDESGEVEVEVGQRRLKSGLS